MIPPTLSAAVRLLSAHRGHLKPTDAAFIDQLLTVPDREWSPRMAFAAYEIARSERVRLLSEGLDVRQVKAPPNPFAPRMLAQARRPAAVGLGTIEATPRTRKWLILRNRYDERLYERLKDMEKRGLRKWDDGERVNRIRLTIDSIPEIWSLIQTFGLHVHESARLLWDEGVREFRRVRSERKALYTLSSALSSDWDVPTLRGGTLDPYQRAAGEYITRVERGIIGDAPGAGKTIECMAAIEHVDEWPWVIVVPAAVKIMWARQLARWLPHRRVKVVTSRSDIRPGAAHIWIINYDILRRRLSDLVEVKPRGIACDESHRLKSKKAQRTQAAQKLAAGCRWRFLLTGTAIKNRPEELIEQLRLLGRLDDVGGVKRFRDLAKGGDLERINRIMRSTCYIRREKSDVMPQLPPKRLAYIPVAIDNAAEYRTASRDVVAYLMEHRGELAAFGAARAEALVKMNTLKHITARGKLRAAKGWIRDFLAEGEKLLVFAHHTDIIEDVAAEFDAPMIHGGISLKKREQVQAEFQAGRGSPLVVLNIQAGGEGIDLFAASNVAFLELGWTPGEHDQAEDRAHRRGQRDAVTAWYLLGEGTIDETIAAMIDDKRRTTDGTLKGEAVVEREGGNVSILGALIGDMLGGDDEQTAAGREPASYGAQAVI